MNNSSINMNNTLIIAKKEWKDIFRNRVFFYIMILLGILIITSVVVSILVFNSQLQEYNKSLIELSQLGLKPATPPPKLYPLNLLRGVVDYVEIIGAVLGIILGYISISKERNTKAMKLLLTRPVTKKEITYGKILGNTAFIFLLMILTSIVISVSLFVISGITLDLTELIKILLFVVISTMYIMIFFMMSFFLSIFQKNITHALILSFIIWLVFVLIFPQIGDTMDPDNQVPGGFFKSMSIEKAQEKTIMQKFSSYETIRNGIEEASITKHYERAIFAFFGIKASYNDMELSAILADQTYNIIWIIAFFISGFIADYLLLSKTKIYLGG